MANGEENALPPEVEEGKALAALGYLGPLFLVPLLGKKENAFCQHHGKQGAVLFGLEVIGVVVLIILTIIINFVSFIVYPGLIFGSFLWVAYWVCVFGVSIWGIVMASKGEYWKMPVVAPLVERMNL